MRSVVLVSIIVAGMASSLAAAPPEVRAPRNDSYGDPLPNGAIARLGTIRWKASERLGSVVFSPDGKLVAGIGDNNQLRIWDFPSGGLLKVHPIPNANSDFPIAPVFTPDQKYLVFGGQNGGKSFAIAVVTGQSYSLLRDTEATNGGIVVSSNGRWGLSWDNDEKRCRLGLRDLNKPQIERASATIPFRAQVNLGTVAVSPDGRWCAIGAFDADNPPLCPGRVYIVDMTTRKMWTSPVLPNANPLRLAFTADSASLIGSTRLSLFRVDIKPGKGESPPDVKPGARFDQRWTGDQSVEAFAVSPDGKRAAAGDCAGQVAIWNAATGKLERAIQVSPINAIRSLAFAPDGKTLAVATEMDAGVRLFDVASGADLLARMGHQAAVSSLDFHPSGKALASASDDDGSIRTWNLLPRRTPVALGSATLVEERISGREHAVLQRASESFDQVAFADKGLLLIASRASGGFVIWDTSKRQRPRILDVPTDGHLIAVSPDGSTIAAAIPEAGVQLLNANTGAVLKKQPAIGEPVLALSFSDDGKVLNVASQSGQFIAWDVAGGVERKRVAAGGGVAERYFAAHMTAESTVLIWDRQSGRLVRRLDQANYPGALSNDGRYIACAGNNGIELREVATGKTIVCWVGAAQNLRALRFAPDGGMVAAGYGDGTILLWDARPPRSSPAHVLNKGELQARFDDLASPEPAKAFAAVGCLAAVPAQTTALIRDRYKLPPPIEPALLARLLADIDHPRYAIREKATRRLEAIVGQVEDSLEQALPRAGVEAARRIERVLLSIQQPTVDAESLRGARIVELLERIADKEARDLLERFTRSRGPIARDARDAMERLRDR